MHTKIFLNSMSGKINSIYYIINYFNCDNIIKYTWKYKSEAVNKIYKETTFVELLVIYRAGILMP